MTQLEKMYGGLIEEGYGRHSRAILDYMASMVQEIAEAKDTLKPQDTQFIFRVKPYTKVTIKIQSL